jgi:predicted dehydrogenase
MSDTPVAILGLGSIGMRHARNFLALGCKVTGFDPADARRAALQEIGGRGVTSDAAALDGAKLAVIASPSQHHLANMETALTAGCHILAEKPLAHTADGLDLLLSQAEARGLRVCVALNLRFLPVTILAVDCILRGMIGQPLWARFICSSYLPEWRPDTDYRKGYAADPVGGGVLFDLVHEFDLANHLLGPAQTASAVAVRTGELDMPTEDCAQVSLRHDSGVISSLHLDYCTLPRRRAFEIAGTTGQLYVNVREQKLQILDRNANVQFSREFATDFADCYVAEARAALRVAEEGAEYPISHGEALSVLCQVIDARRMAGLL